MPDVRKIVVEINENKTTKVVNDSGDVNVDVRSLLHPVKTLENVAFGKNTLVNQAYQNAKNLVIQALELSLGRYYALSEDYIAENSINNLKVGINKVSTLVSVVGGAAMVGGAAGAAMAAVGWGASQIVSGINAKNNYYANINAATYQTEFLKKRASLVDNSQGTEN